MCPSGLHEADYQVQHNRYYAHNGDAYKDHIAAQKLAGIQNHPTDAGDRRYQFGGNERGKRYPEGSPHSREDER
jgi:hypothetical protein